MTETQEKATQPPTKLRSLFALLTLGTAAVLTVAWVGLLGYALGSAFGII